MFELWCNGNTADFGSVVLGSNPGSSTRKGGHATAFFVEPELLPAILPDPAPGKKGFSGMRRGGIPGSLFPGGFSGFPAHAAGGGRCGRFGPVRAGNGALGVFFLHLGGGVRRALRRFVQFPGEERQRLCGFIGRGAGLPVVFLFFHTNVRLADLAV